MDPMNSFDTLFGSFSLEKRERDTFKDTLNYASLVVTRNSSPPLTYREPILSLVVEAVTRHATTVAKRRAVLQDRGSLDLGKPLRVNDQILQMSLRLLTAELLLLRSQQQTPPSTSNTTEELRNYTPLYIPGLSEAEMIQYEPFSTWDPQVVEKPGELESWLDQVLSGKTTEPGGTTTEDNPWLSSMTCQEVLSPIETSNESVTDTPTPLNSKEEICPLQLPRFTSPVAPCLTDGGTPRKYESTISKKLPEESQPSMFMTRKRKRFLNFIPPRPLYHSTTSSNTH